jgi:hypothetical protein
MTGSRGETRARLGSPGGWGQVADSTTMPRYAELMPGRYRNRRRCDCGCEGKASHTGMVNGLGMTSGCELSIRRWARSGVGPTRQRQTQLDGE